MWKHVEKTGGRERVKPCSQFKGSKPIESSEKYICHFWESWVGRCCQWNQIASYCPHFWNNSHWDIIGFMHMMTLKYAESFKKPGSEFPPNSLQRSEEKPWATFHVIWVVLKVVVGKFLHPQSQPQILLSNTVVSWNTPLMWELHSIFKQHTSSGHQL